jgi:hypothetical protein
VSLIPPGTIHILHYRPYRPYLLNHPAYGLYTLSYSFRIASSPLFAFPLLLPLSVLRLATLLFLSVPVYFAAVGVSIISLSIVDCQLSKTSSFAFVVATQFKLKHATGPIRDKYSDRSLILIPIILFTDRCRIADIVDFAVRRLDSPYTSTSSK